MYEPTDFTLIKTNLDKPPKFTNGMADGRGRLELGTARKMLDNVGKSHFSVVAFGSYMNAAAHNDEELEKMLLSCLYFIQNVAERESSIGYMSRRIMDCLDSWGYTSY